MKKMIAFLIGAFLCASLFGCTQAPEAPESAAKPENQTETQNETAQPSEQDAGVTAQPTWQVAWANYSGDAAIFAGCLNGRTMLISSVQHLPIYKFDSKAELAAFRARFADSLCFDQGHDEVPSFDAVAAEIYTDGFFADHSLILVYVQAGSGSFRYGVREVACENGAFTVAVAQANAPEEYTCDMAGWFVFVEPEKAALSDCTEFDAYLAPPLTPETASLKQLPGMVEYGTFSFEDAKKALETTNAPVTLQTEGFVNVDAIEGFFPYDRAKAEAAGDYDLSQTYRDEAADVWMVRFFSSKKSGSKTVYLDGKGRTLLIATED